MRVFRSHHSTSLSCRLHWAPPAPPSSPAQHSTAPIQYKHADGGGVRLIGGGGVERWGGEVGDVDSAIQLQVCCPTAAPETLQPNQTWLT